MQKKLQRKTSKTNSAESLAIDSLSGPGFSGEGIYYDSVLRCPVQKAKTKGSFKNNAGAGLPSNYHPYVHAMSSGEDLRGYGGRSGSFGYGVGPANMTKSKRKGLTPAEAREHTKSLLTAAAKEAGIQERKKRDAQAARAALDMSEDEGRPPASPAEERHAIHRHRSIVDEDNRTHYQRFLRD